MEHLLIVYYTGVGNTKKVAEEIYDVLIKKSVVDMYDIFSVPHNLNLDMYDGIVFGFPVIHGAPAKRMLIYLEQLGMAKKVIPTFLFATCGLYSANTLRIFAKRSRIKNFIPIVSNSYRCPATDGMLIAPFMNIWFRPQKNIQKKINEDAKLFLDRIQNNNVKIRMPRFKLYSIFNYPNKLIGQKTTFPIYLHEDKCVKCGVCIKNCKANSLILGDGSYPIFNAQNCEKCYRCIHHCPNLALSLSKQKTPKKVWNYS